MRPVPCLIVVICLCLGPGGCALFNKKSGGKDASAAAGTPARGEAAETGDPLFSQRQQPQGGGMLAGRVIEAYSGRPVEAFVRYECLDGPGGDRAPVEVAVRTDGFFTIPGLTPGKQYKLTARSKQESKVLAGTTYTTAPNVRLVIKLSEGLATKDTPPVPKAPSLQNDKSDGQNPTDKKGETPGEKSAGAQSPTGWEPGVGSITVPPRGPVADIRGPQPLQPGDNPSPPRKPAEDGWKRMITEKERARPNDPLLDIKGGWPRTPTPAPAPAPPPPAPPPSPAIPNGATPMTTGSQTPVPSCSLVGKQLHNMALHDVAGDPWEWRTHRKGKLVLLDFWSTTCLPCRDAIPHLRVLQGQYGWAGLEVIGIACEGNGTPQQQANRVASLCNRMQTNYRLLLAGESNNPVRVQFGIQYLPTLVLLDERGQVLWRHQGALDRDTAQILDRQIRAGLNIP